MIDFNKIKEAVARRDAFLKEHPELQELQETVNLALSKAANQHERNRILQEMLLNTWHKVIPIWEGK